MLSARMVRMIEDHAEQLTRGALQELQTNPRTRAYHKLSRDELHHRLYDVYRNLGRWLTDKTEEAIEASYGALGHRRSQEGVPLEEVVYALILTKHHLWDYVRTAGLVASAVELYQEEELNLLIDRFFDKAIYYTVRGYQGASASVPASA